MGERRHLADDALAALDDELLYLRGRLAVLERARDIIAEGDGYDSSCDGYHPASPCHGKVQARWCATCGQVWRRCLEHGGVRAATHDLGIHHADTGHPPSNAGRVRGRTEAVPVGRVPTPPADHVEAERPASAPRTQASPAVIRRRTGGARMGGGGRDAA